MIELAGGYSELPDNLVEPDRVGDYFDREQSDRFQGSEMSVSRTAIDSLRSGYRRWHLRSVHSRILGRS